MTPVREYKSSDTPARGFRLDRSNGKLMGVASGIAAWSGLNTTLVRLGFVLGAFISLGTAALVYLAIGLIAD